MSEIKTRFRTVDGLSIRYAESDKPHEHEALLLSPWPESLYAYDAGWSRLAEHAHLIAVDLPGFGHSELREDLLSPKAMGEFIVRLADAFGLAKPHVVGPDIGTSAVLFAAAQHPDRFRSAVVGTGGAAVPLQLGGVLDEWVHAEDLAPYRALGPKDIMTAAIANIEGYELPEVVREDYLAAYTGQRFVDQMPYVRAYPDELPVLSGLLPGIETPVQVIAGRHDPVVPLANAEYLHERLPNSRLDIIDVGHFVWEEGADDYAKAVTGWWQAN
ncbi:MULTISPECIES: alpha/beta fold hydrolase [Streptomyces]|uniref:Alpha/beta hydrolase n=1 Tax=Streptomyces rhizosphaericus TaxID=114699 RepID=A0A6G4A8T7_9ACTN|nr:alpha/beta hydrolase [Streptomyces rhizosphaericus]MBI0375693.1 alpha/beta hydrolase [Streptomyces albiflaviniger]NEW69783.1 alpha/beta hydrolase [Streptomyces rhizosphaericus]